MVVLMLGNLLKSLNWTTIKPLHSTKLRCLLLPTSLSLSERNMGSSALSPPSNVRGMKQLQKELFIKRLSVPCLILPVKSIVQAKPALKSYMLKLQNFRPMQELPIKGESGVGKIMYSDKFSGISQSKIAVLDPEKMTCYDDMKSEHQDILLKCDIKNENFLLAQVDIGYDNWKADEILRAVIPEEYDGVSGYSICGHIIHLNLREHLEDYKDLIGQVLLEKVANARTVVNKIDNIDTTFRTFKMEILRGDDDMVANVKENKCTFIFDFSKVYWNSRLSTEHERVVSYVKRGDVLYDVFCGVGPFSIPAAKKGCRVVANDLNPESIRWLKESAKVNKTDFQISCKDGRDFIEEDIKKDWMGIDDSFRGDIHIAMNLPGLAVDFLPAFRDLFNRNEMEHVSKLPPPKVYVYCFTKGEENPADAAKLLVETKLDYKFVGDELIDVTFVRNVAPMKEMMRVAFRLSPAIISRLDKRSNSTDNEEEEPIKKLCSQEKLN